MELLSQANTSMQDTWGDKKITPALVPTSVTHIDVPASTGIIDDEIATLTPISPDEHIPITPMVNMGYESPNMVDDITEETLSDFEDEDESDIDSDDDSDDDMPFTELLLHLSQVSDELEFAEHGYQKISKITDTLQGELYKAKRLSHSNSDCNQYVAIKKCEKTLHKKRESVQDGMNFIVSEDMVKESLILKYLTLDNHPIASYITKYIDFFELDDDYYLVTEYIDSEMNLKQFIETAFSYINSNKLKLSHYQKVIKHLFCQLTNTIRWMHHDMNCCHLDLCLENIMLTNCDFIEQSDGTITINQDIGIKLADFGVAEVFQFDNYQCTKRELSLDNDYKLEPKIFQDEHEIYDAQKADVWSLGIILFECMTGRELYKGHEIWNELRSEESGYWALQNYKLAEYVMTNNLSRYLEHDCISLLSHLLDINESNRYSADNIIGHKWYNVYFDRYHQHQEESITKEQNIPEIMLDIPYYVR